MDTHERVARSEIGETQQRAIASILERVQVESGARTVLLARVCGRPLAVSGEQPLADMDSLASLAAAVAAASCRLVSLLGEEDTSLLFQRGERDVVQLTPARDFILTLVFAHGAPQGLERLRARLRQRRALADIARVLDTGEAGEEERSRLRDLGEEEIDRALAPVAPIT